MGIGKVDLHCRTCEAVLPVLLNTTTGILCTCGGSKYTLRGDQDQYSFQCPKCNKEFLIDNGANFDCREFQHCQLHIFKINPVAYRKEKLVDKEMTIQEQSVKSIDKSAKYLTSAQPEKIINVPIEAEAILKMKEILPKDVFKIGIVKGNEQNHKKYMQLEILVDALSQNFHVIQFDPKFFDQNALVMMNECDLVVGQYTNALKYAFMLHIPVIILHTEVDTPYRGEVSYFGLKDINASQLLNHIRNIILEPPLSYCIVTHNRKELAMRCLNTIFEYRKMSEEIVIVDNASTDGIKELHEKIRNVSNVQIIFNEKNIGCTLARNQAMKAAKGRTLLLLDSDQIIGPDTVHRMRLCGGDIIGSEAWTIDKRGRTQKLKPDAKDFDYVGAGGMIVPKQMAQTLNYFDEQFIPGYYEDPDFCLRARERGYDVRVCESNIEHRGPGMDEALGNEAEKIKEDNKNKFIKKWAARFDKDVIAKLPTRPQIMMLVDVPGWAWDVKAQNIRKWLGDDYTIHIRYQHEYGDFITDNFDVYFVFDCVFVRRLAGKQGNRIVGGVTAHTYVNFDGYKGLLARCGAVHANSVMLYEELRQINQNAFYCPNGVDEELFSFQQRDIRKAFTVGYVGKNHDRKGFNNFIVPACEKAGVKLKSQTAKYNEKGKIEPKDMPAFYHDVDCVVIASDMDGTPNQLLEAAAVGRTFVGVKIGNVPEFINDESDKRNGFMVPRTVDAIADRFSWLKSNRKECREMGIAARKTVEDAWTWKHQAENYRKLFDSVLKGLT